MDEEEEYNDEVSDEDVSTLINRANKSESEVIKLTNVINSLSGERKDENFLHHQIETSEMIDKLEHFYKGDTQSFDDEGNIIWKEQINKDLVTFNEFGVSSFMEIITKYIDRNTILSDYTEKRIYEIMADLGDEIILFMLCNLTRIGMDTQFKQSKFRLVIITTTHIIESTYRRAIGGKTLIELNQSKVVGQFGNPQGISQGRPRREGFFSRLVH